MKKLFACLLALLVALSCFVGCSANAPTSQNAAVDAKAEVEMPMEEPMAPEVWEEEAPEMAEADFSASSAEGGIQTEMPDFAEKIIYSGNISVETTTFDQALNALERAVSEAGGFIQDSNTEGYSRTNADGTTSVVDRWANYTVRIPSDRFDGFMTRAGDIGNVLSSSRSAENVTSQYTDYQARLESLQIQEERLLDMLKKSGELKDLITLEDHLAQVRYEIDSIQRNLKNLDQRLSYSTVYLHIQEVEVYTPTVGKPRTFGEKLSDAFADGWNGFVRGIQRLVLWFASSLPTLVVLAVLTVAAICTVRRIRRKKKARVQDKEEENP